MLFTLQRYDYKVQSKGGVEMYLADTLSRAPLPLRDDASHQSTDEVSRVDTHSIAEQEIEAINMFQFLPASDQMLARIQSETDADEEMANLKMVVRQGWPDTQAGGFK